MDLLQEINNRIRDKASGMWGKFYGLFYDATLGLAKEYRRKTLALVKITAGSVYLQLIKLARKHLQLLFLAIFASGLVAVTVVVIPVAIILVTDWPAETKIVCLSGLGLVYIAAVALSLHFLFSEEKWLKASGFQELLDSIPTDRQ